MGQAARSPALVALLTFVVALLAWFGWRTCAGSESASPAVELPARGETPAYRHAQAAPLETPEGETTGERLAGAPEAPPRAQSQPVEEVLLGAFVREAIRCRGTVLDLDLDMPLPGVSLVFVGEKARELGRVESDSNGRFCAPELSERPRWLVVEPPEDFLCDEPRIDLGGRLGDILVPLHRDPKLLAGAIHGELLREGGSWTRETLPKSGSVMLDLVPVSGARWSRRAQLVSERDPAGGFHLRFCFDNLPHGEYELTLSSLAAWRWNPTSLRISPPIDNITFLRYDLDRSSELVFRVSDRATGEAIEPFQVRALALTPSSENGVFLHTGPLETSAVPDEARFEWSLWAEGYQPAFGNENAFVRRGGQRIAEVALERGWATKVLVLMRDPSAKPALRAEVWLDGRFLGLTGANGMLTAGAEAAPKRLEVRFSGWHMSNDPLQPYGGKSAAQRGQVTIVMLEKDP